MDTKIFNKGEQNMYEWNRNEWKGFIFNFRDFPVLTQFSQSESRRTVAYLKSI